jgi:sugar O-acyltransferase (sialic acid O-acetyltransferase NeuD family)
MIFYGAGGHAKVVIEAWIASGGKVAAVFDDNESIKTLLGKSVSGKYQPDKFRETTLMITVGNNKIRKEIAVRVRNPFGKVIHPSAIISSSAKVNEGSVVMAGGIIQAETVVGKHAIINTSASVDHDCFIGDFVHVAPGVVLCGDVRIGEGSLIGAGSVILPGVSVGKWAVVGAGSVVTTNVPDFAIALGVPSKVRS